MRGERSILIVLALAAGLMLLHAGKPANKESDRAKARYYLMQAIEKDALNQQDQAYEYAKKALRLDPDNAEASYFVTDLNMMLKTDYNAQDTLAGIKFLNSIEQGIKPYYTRYPDDPYEAKLYATIVRNLGRPGEAVAVYNHLATKYPEQTSLLQGLSNLYFEMDSLDKTLEVLNLYGMREGNSPDLTARIARVKLESRDTLGAIETLRVAAEGNPKNEEYRILEASLMNALDRPDDALKALLIAEQANPEAGSVKYHLAQTYLSRGDSLKYDDYTYKALISESLDVDTKVSVLGMYSYQLLSDSSDTKRGDYLYAVMLDQYPHESAVLDLVSRYAASKGDYSQAAEYAAYALDMSPKDPELRMMLLTYLYSDDNFGEVVKEYREAEKLGVANNDMRLITTTSAMLNKDFDTAQDILTAQLREILPDQNLFGPITDRVLLNSLDYDQLMQASDYFCALGDVLYEKGEPESGFVAYDNSLFFNPENKLAFNNYAYFLALSNRDLERAEKMSAAAVKMDPESTTYLDTYAYVLFRLERYDEALEVMNHILEILSEDDPSNADIYEHYGDILSKTGDVSGARKAWQKALKDSDNKKILKRKIDSGKYLEE